MPLREAEVAKDYAKDKYYSYMERAPTYGEKCQGLELTGKRSKQANFSERSK